MAAYGATPTQLLADHGVLGPMTTAVHATRVTTDDIHHLGATRTRCCFCPTTERDLGDGVGPSRELHDAGSPLTLGSDSHAVIDPFEEMRAVEMDERLAQQSRGHWSAAELLAAGDDHRPRQPRLPRRRRDPGGCPSRPGHPRHHHPADRRHRRRRADRGLRGHRGRHRPGDRRRPRRPHHGDDEEIGRELAAAIEGLHTYTLINNIGELVTNDPEADDLLGIIERAGAGHRRCHGRLGGPGRRGTGCRPAGRRRRPRGAAGLRRLPLTPGLRR